MKTTLLFLSILLSLFSSAQQAYNTWTYDGVSREYISYVPESYTPGEPIPVVFVLHGLGDTMDNFYQIGMDNVADTANFIVIFPQALPDGLTGANAWNSGAGAFGISLNPEIDDVGFIGAIIDTLDAHYTLDHSRIYSCGFSMGGFMSNRLACEMNDRIAAIASVAGTIGGELQCDPSNPIPVCHFHGTTDGTVAYTNNLFGNDAEELCAYWSSNNGCDEDPTITNLPDSYNDGYSVSHWVYTNCVDHGDVELFKITGADHVWLTSGNDIDYVKEIWRFFYRQQLPEELLFVESTITKLGVEIYPNPFQSILTIQGLSSENSRVEIYSSTGSLIQQENVRDTRQLNLAHLSSGIYFVKIVSAHETVLKQIIKE